MIHLLDEPIHENSHSGRMLQIIKQHTSVPVVLTEIPVNPAVSQIVKIVHDLMSKVLPSDIVVCAWAVSVNEKINAIFEDLAQCCFVIVAAGNSNAEIEEYSPTSVDDVIVVGCLNKKGEKASLSNYSNTRTIEWVTGTNYNIDGTLHSGTSISAALYAAFLAESIQNRDPKLVEELIDQRKMEAFSELS
jgi:hypothetical protein